MSFLKFGRGSGEGIRSTQAIENALLWRGDSYQPSQDVEAQRTSIVSQTARPPCGNPECSGGWTVPWRSRHRPVFEGRWGCSGRCVLAMVRAAVRRESREGTELLETPHRHRVPLGLTLLAQGWITQEQLRKALDAQREHGHGRVGDWLVSECGVEMDHITRGLSVQWGCPVLNADGFVPGAMARVMPRIFVEQFGMVPLRVAGSRILYLGFGNRMDASLAFAVEQMSALQVQSGLVAESQFGILRDRLLHCDCIDTTLDSLPDTDSLAARVTAVLEHKQPMASKLVRVHQYLWLRMWLEASAMSRAGNLSNSHEDTLDYVFSVGGST